MDATDRGLGDGFEDKGAGVWTRRDLIKAVGTGLALTAVPRREVMAGVPLPNVEIDFSGAMLYQTDPQKRWVEILVPATSPKVAPTQHADSTPAAEHYCYLAVFTRNANGWQLGPKGALNGDILFGSGSAIDASLNGIPDMQKIAKGDSELRSFDDANTKPYFGARIRLQGGVVKPLCPAVSATWTFSKHLNRDAPQSVRPATGIKWTAPGMELQLPSEVAQSLGIARLVAAANTRFIIGHLPMLPAMWFAKPPRPYKSFVDHDFKWLYRVVVPERKSGTIDPWPVELKERVLPAPRCGVVPLFGNDYEDATIDSPTCFGGCWGCD